MYFLCVLLKKVDSSKAGTLEAAAKPEPPPPVQEEKKADSKSSFLSFFKPKVRTDSLVAWKHINNHIPVEQLQKVTD